MANPKHPYPLGVKGASPRGKFKPFKASLAASHLPSSVSYWYGMPSVYDQGDMSDCVANATNACVSFFLKKRHNEVVDLSRAATYSQGKLDYEQADFSEPGMYPASALELFQAKGGVLESTFPSTDANVTSTSALPASDWNASYEIKTFTEVDNNVNAIKQALHSAGPVIFAVDWQNSWFVPDKNNVLPAPDYSAGGHCILIVGYDDAKQAFMIRNSWGSSWALHGYAWMPYEFVANYAMNSYTIQITN